MFSATLREWKRKIEQLRQRWRAVRQENERLRKETEVLRRREKQWESEREQWERERKRLERERERLREEIDNLNVSWKKLSGLTNDKPPPSPGAREKSIRKPRDASRVLLMADDTANSLPSRWTKSFPCPCLGGVAAGEG